MAILKIAQLGEPVLRQRAEEVGPAEIASPAIQRFIDGVTDPATLTRWKNFERFHQAGFAEQAAALVRRYGA